MIQIEQPGLLSTIQDLGRSGWQHLGVTPGGVMDGYSAVLANALVGNALDAAVLEITLHGPRLHFEVGAWLSITGADLSAELNGNPLPIWRPVWVPAGSRLCFSRPRSGCRAYLAIAGGFVAPLILGSRGTDIRAGFGGLAGRPLRAGDILEFYPSSLPLPHDPKRRYATRWCIAWYKELALESSTRLRLIPGPDWFSLTVEGQSALMENVYRVGPQSDRMGLRLEGPSLRLSLKGERLTAGVAFGTLQLPPGGQPILLGADRQTTGGYPVLGTVASIDHPRLAQLRPGDPIRFEPITIERAQTLYRAHVERLQRLLIGIQAHWPLSGMPDRDYA